MIPEQFLRWVLHPGMFWEKTPEESDADETPRENRELSDILGGNKSPFLTRFAQECQEYSSPECENQACFTLGPGYSCSRWDIPAHGVVLTVSRRYAGLKGDLRGVGSGNIRK